MNWGFFAVIPYLYLKFSYAAGGIGMRIAARFAFSVSLTVCILAQFGFAQQTSRRGSDDEQLIASYQSKLDTLGNFYGFQFRTQPWRHDVLNVCPEFEKHLFVLYQRVDLPTVGFIAVFAIPNGRVRLVRLEDPKQPSAEPPLLRPSTVIAFNAILREERVGSGNGAAIVGADGARLAACYAEMAGAQPVLARRAPSGAATASKDAPTDAVQANISSVQIGLASSNPSLTVDLLLSLDKHGSVANAQLFTSPKLREFP
jgi:hypothetical protein